MELRMRSSKVLRKLRSGEVATCFKVNLGDPRSTEIAAMHGFDCIWTCMEHVGNDWSTVGAQILAAKAWDADILCRVSRGSYSDYVRPFELDAAGIMVPHVMSGEDAASVVRMVRFPPVGRRAVDGGNADAAYCNVPFLEYLREANSERFVILQIEDPESVDRLEEIAAVEGYDMLFFGPGDFSVAIGDPANFENPRLLELRRRIPEIARRHGKYAGTVCNPRNRAELIGEGYRFLSMGADVVGLSHYCASIAEAAGISVPGSQALEYGQPAEGKRGT
jgi:4-hydroxy-2-oxoheptanedioate aldolase